MAPSPYDLICWLDIKHQHNNMFISILPSHLCRKGYIAFTFTIELVGGWGGEGGGGGQENIKSLSLNIA